MSEGDLHMRLAGDELERRFRELGRYPTRFLVDLVRQHEPMIRCGLAGDETVLLVDLACLELQCREDPELRARLQDVLDLEHKAAPAEPGWQIGPPMLTEWTRKNKQKGN